MYTIRIRCREIFSWTRRIMRWNNCNTYLGYHFLGTAYSCRGLHIAHLHLSRKLMSYLSHFEATGEDSAHRGRAHHTGMTLSTAGNQELAASSRLVRTQRNTLDYSFHHTLYWRDHRKNRMHPDSSLQCTPNQRLPGSVDLEGHHRRRETLTVHI